MNNTFRPLTEDERLDNLLPLDGSLDHLFFQDQAGEDLPPAAAVARMMVSLGMSAEEADLLKNELKGE